MNAADDNAADDLSTSWGNSPRYHGHRRARPPVRRRLVLAAVVAGAGTAVVALFTVLAPPPPGRSVAVPSSGAALPTDAGIPSPSGPAQPSPGPGSSASWRPVPQPPLPSSASSPTTAPVSFPPVTYEAEAAANTLAGSARVASYDGASGGRIVRNIGAWGGDPAGTLRFEGVTVPADGTYTLRLFHVNLNDEPSRTAVIAVSGGPSVVVTVSGGATCCATATVTIALRKGANQITFGNPNGHAPSIDKIVISAS
jgi:hypothetical protein